MLLNGVVADEAGGLALDPNNPPPGVEFAVFVWPNRLLEPPLVAGGLKKSDGLDFPWSDMVFEGRGMTLGLGSLLAVDLRRGALGLGRDISGCRRSNLPREGRRIT